MSVNHPDMKAAYLDNEIDQVHQGDAHFWRNMHWGLFDHPEIEDDSPERYLWAAGRMTERIIASGEVADGTRVLDVGCGFGGTLDYVGDRNKDCRLIGINVDERQLQQGRGLLAEHGAAKTPVSLVAADGCSLPVADNSVDHVLAVECIFHFPSRKEFFREAARVLRPGGTLALSDFLVRPGSMKAAAQRLNQDMGAVNEWFGSFSVPKTPQGYERLGRGAGFDVLRNEDVTAQTMPTYPALRRLAELGERNQYHDVSIKAVNSLESFAADGIVAYHILSFRRRST